MIRKSEIENPTFSIEIPYWEAGSICSAIESAIEGGNLHPCHEADLEILWKRITDGHSSFRARPVLPED